MRGPAMSKTVRGKFQAFNLQILDAEGKLFLKFAQGDTKKWSLGPTSMGCINATQNLSNPVTVARSNCKAIIELPNFGGFPQLLWMKQQSPLVVPLANPFWWGDNIAKNKFTNFPRSKISIKGHHHCCSTGDKATHQHVIGDPHRDLKWTGIAWHPWFKIAPPFLGWLGQWVVSPSWSRPLRVLNIAVLQSTGGRVFRLPS